MVDTKDETDGDTTKVLNYLTYGTLDYCSDSLRSPPKITMDRALVT